MRLAELTAPTDDRAKEAPLRRDVRSLGVLLGRVLVDQAGESVFKTVEQLRRLLIQSRAHTARSQSSSDEMQQAANIVQGLSIEQAHRVTKAFAIYFELTNLGRNQSPQASSPGGKTERQLKPHCRAHSAEPCSE